MSGEWSVVRVRRRTDLLSNLQFVRVDVRCVYVCQLMLYSHLNRQPSNHLLVYLIARKLKPMLIFKGSPAPKGKTCGGSNTITYAIEHNLPDQWGNHFPSPDDVYITVTKTANSSGTKTIDYLDKVFFPAMGAEDRELKEPAGLLLDAFRGHFAEEVKEVTEPMKDMLSWLLMDGGITPKAQPLDVLINKVFKGLYRDLFEEWSLNAPINDQTGHPYAPSRQLLAMWVVQAWKKIPEELVKKAWVVSGYTDMVDLEDQAASREIVEYSTEDLGSMIEKYVGDDAMMAWIDECNEHDPDFLFPEEDEDEDVVGEGEVEDSSSEEEESSSDEESDESESDGEFIEKPILKNLVRRNVGRGRPKRDAGSYKDGPARYDRRKLSFLVG